MKYFSALVAVMAGSALVSAAPSLDARASCDPHKWQSCGTCHAKVCELPMIGAVGCKKDCSNDGNFCGIKAHDASGMAVCN